MPARTFLTLLRPSWGHLSKIRTSKSHASAPGGSFDLQVWAAEPCHELWQPPEACLQPIVCCTLSWATAGPASSQQDQQCLIYAVPLYFTENMWAVPWDFFILLHICWAVVTAVCSLVLQLVLKNGKFHGSSAWTCWQGWAWELSRDRKSSPHSEFEISSALEVLVPSCRLWKRTVNHTKKKHNCHDCLYHPV